MTTIGGRPKGLQNFLSNVKSTLSRGKKASGKEVQGDHTGSQTSFSSDGYSTDKDKNNPYLTLLPLLPRGDTAQARPSGRQAPSGYDAMARPTPAAMTAQGASLSRSKAMRSPAAGVAVRGRARATSGASLRTVNSAQTQSSAASKPGSFNQELLNQASPLERLMQSMSKQAQASSKEPQKAAIDEDLWAHLG